VPRRADRAAVRRPLRPDHPLGLQQDERALTARVTGRLGPDVTARLAVMATTADDDDEGEGDGAEPSALRDRA
jgi:hypothetical protein